MSESGESESSVDGGFRMKEVLLAAGFVILEMERVEKRRVLEVIAGREHHQAEFKKGELRMIPRLSDSKMPSGPGQLSK